MDSRRWIQEFLEELRDKTGREHVLHISDDVLLHLVAGAISGPVSRTLTAPFDRVKLFMQVSMDKMSIYKCLTDMLQEGGIKGLWRGNGMNVLKVTPEMAFKFAAYEKIKKMMREEHRTFEIYERFCAGAAAGVISQLATYPMDVIKTKLALGNTGEYLGIVDCIRKIYEIEGIKAFYRGYKPSCIGIIPFTGVDLAVYETMKRRLLPPDSESPYKIWILLVSGFVSTTAAQLASYPLYLVKTRMQAETGQSISPRPTLTSVFRKILAKQGVTGLYRGMTPNLLKILPAGCINYLVYEYCNRYFGVSGFVHGLSDRNSIDQYKRLREVVWRPTGSVTDRYHQVALPHHTPAPSPSTVARPRVDLACSVEHSYRPILTGIHLPVCVYTLKYDDVPECYKTACKRTGVAIDEILCYNPFIEDAFSIFVVATMSSVMKVSAGWYTTPTMVYILNAAIIYLVKCVGVRLLDDEWVHYCVSIWCLVPHIAVFPISSNAGNLKQLKSTHLSVAAVRKVDNPLTVNGTYHIRIQYAASLSV
ncbi:Short Calcium-binding Mitochondrial Carrier [Carabus blaptoides fortunei]